MTKNTKRTTVTDTPLRLLRTERRLLPCILTEEERRQYSKQLAARYQDSKDMKESHKSMKSAMSADEQAIDAEVSRVATILNTGIESRTVDVQVRAGLEGKVVETRTDTGEILIVREGRPEELQIPFDDETLVDEEAPEPQEEPTEDQ